jgi:MFS family permease
MNQSAEIAGAAEASVGAELKRHWPALIVGAWGGAVGLMGLMFYSFSSFVPLFEAREGWSRAEVSISLFATSIGILFAAPLVGRIIDRAGVRIVLLISIPLLAIGLLLPIFASSQPWTLWAAYFVMSVIGIGASPIACARLITARFFRARGLALGVVLAGTGVSALALPPFLAAITSTWGVNGGYVSLAVLAMTPWLYVLAFVKDTPAAQPSAQQAATETGGAGEKSWGLFLLIAVSFFVVSLGLTGVVVHLVAMMRDVGLSAAQAGMVASGVGIGVIGARIVIGWVLDHIYAPAVALGVFVIAAAGCLLLAYGDITLAIVAAALIGVAIGGEIDLIAYLVSRYFPPQRFASVYGWQYGIFTLGASLSPLTIDAFRSDDGGYAIALTGAAIAVIVGGLPLLTLGRYRY